jgi:hypothetical protein
VELLGTRGIGDWHWRIGRAGAWGAHAPSNFYGWAEIHASFGQNIKIPEKLWYVRENFRMFAKIINIRENFLICPENFLYVCRIYGLLGKFFWGCPAKKCCAPPLARQQFPGEILINHGRAKTVPHQTRLGPSAHGDWLTTRMQML